MENINTELIEMLHQTAEMQKQTAMMLQQISNKMLSAEMSEEHLLLTIDEAAEKLGRMTPSDVRNMCKDGLLTEVKVKNSERRRVTLASVKKYVESLDSIGVGGYHSNEHNIMKKAKAPITRSEIEKFRK